MIIKNVLYKKIKTKYIKERIIRESAYGYLGEITIDYIIKNNIILSNKKIKIYNILTFSGIVIKEQLISYNAFKNIKTKKIRFVGTVYKLHKCKSKNDQSPGSKEKYEIINPRNITPVYIKKKKKVKSKKIQKPLPEKVFEQI